MADEASCTDRVVTLAGGETVGIAEYGLPDGLPVLALHGAPASRLMFAVADEHARRAGLRLICPDRPGYGLTPPDDAPTLNTRVARLEQIADAVGFERFAILAISGGAPYGAALAERLGSRVTALALVSPMGPIADLIAAEPAAKRAVPFVQRRFFLHLPYRWIFPPLAGLLAWLFMASPRGFTGGLPRIAGDPDAHILRQPHVREAMLLMTREALRQGAAGGVADLKLFGRPWGIDLERISAPSVLWQGTADRVVPVAASFHLARSIPGCRLVPLDGAGHFWVFNHFAEVCAELGRLVATSGAVTATDRT